MGYGTKTDFSGKNRSPSPDKYRISSQFELIKDRSTRLGDAFGSPKKTFAFGAGREDFSKTVVNTTNM